jgi:hypothetical protein
MVAATAQSRTSKNVNDETQRNLSVTTPMIQSRKDSLKPLPIYIHESCMSKRQINRSRFGGSIVELPLLLFTVLVLLLVPLVGLATMAYRNALFSWAVKNACTEACKAHSFGAAKSAANSSLDRACGSFTGLSLQKCSTSIISQSMDGAVETISETPLPVDAIKEKENLYFIRVKANARLEPIVHVGAGLLSLTPIPGLTAAYPIETTCQLFFEHPKGLSS